MNFLITPIAFFLWFIICGIVSYVLREKTKEILYREGIDYNEFFVTGKNLGQLNKLIQVTNDQKRKTEYRRLLWFQILSIPIYIIVGFSIVFFI